MPSEHEDIKNEVEGLADDFRALENEIDDLRNDLEDLRGDFEDVQDHSIPEVRDAVISLISITEKIVGLLETRQNPHWETLSYPILQGIRYDLGHISL